MKCTIIIFFLIICCFGIVKSEETRLVTGIVLDSETGLPIAGATIRLVESNKGTYTNSNGRFRLLAPQGRQILRISSLGYQSLRINLQDRSDSISIKLKPSPVVLRDVEVIANITAEQVVTRAISKKRANMRKISTFSGLLYSKLTMELGGSMLEANASSGQLSISAPFRFKKADTLDDSFKLFVMETFSRNYIDFPNKVNHTEIIQRRQTSNIPAENNVLALGNYQSFYEERIKIINAEFATPLATDALIFYRFEIIDRTMIDNRYVYILSVIPKTKTFPAFEGTIKIIEGTYNLIEVNLRPSDKSAISFVEDLNFLQKFEEIKSDIWYPTYLDVNAKVKLELLRNFADIYADFRTVSIYSEMSVNEALPDSVYSKALLRISIASGADTPDLYFWEQNSLREITPRELEIYQKVAENMALRDSVEVTKKKFNYNLMPYIDFNRVGSLSIGGGPELNYLGYQLDGKYIYSFGQKEHFGDVYFYKNFKITKKIDVNFRTSAFSLISETGNIQSYSRLANSALSAVSHSDYYNYLRKDGFAVGFDFNYRNLSVWADFESSRHSNLNVSTRRSVFLKKKFRDNPLIETGSFNTITTGILLSNNHSFDLFGDNFTYSFDVSTIYGGKQISGNSFRGVESKLHLKVPTFKTGYLRMMLDLYLHSGISSRNIPSQNKFLLNSQMFYLNSAGTFATSSNCEYGGTEFAAAHINLNMRDLIWRALRLPLYNGRGLEFIVGGSIAKFNDLSKENKFKDTGNSFYVEAGFGIGKIPTFINNILFLETNFRWGLGDLANRRFGGNIGISTPL